MFCEVGFFPPLCMCLSETFLKNKQRKGGIVLPLHWGILMYLTACDAEPENKCFCYSSLLTVIALQSVKILFKLQDAINKFQNIYANFKQKHGLKLHYLSSSFLTLNRSNVRSVEIFCTKRKNLGACESRKLLSVCQL